MPKLLVWMLVQSVGLFRESVKLFGPSVRQSASSNCLAACLCIWIVCPVAFQIIYFGIQIVSLVVQTVYLTLKVSEQYV